MSVWYSVKGSYDRSKCQCGTQLKGLVVGLNVSVVLS